MRILQIAFDDGALTREGLLRLLGFAVAVVLSLVLHEVAHGVVALWNGDNTAKISGRLSLNPLRHFDLTGLLMMLVVGFGWAKPVPVNPYNFKNRRAGMIGVSVAGVLTNFLLAFLFGAVYVAVASMNVEFASSKAYYLTYFVVYLSIYSISINVSLGIFNLLPLYPLDGFRLLSCFVDSNSKFMRFLTKYSFYIIIGCIVMEYVPVLSDYAPFNVIIDGVGGKLIDSIIMLWGKYYFE